MQDNLQAPHTSPLPKPGKTVKTLDFFEALRAVMNGERITRLEWENEANYGWLDGGRLRIMLDDGKHEWLITDGDMLAMDWYVI